MSIGFWKVFWNFTVPGFWIFNRSGFIIFIGTGFGIFVWLPWNRRLVSEFLRVRVSVNNTSGLRIFAHDRCSHGKIPLVSEFLRIYKNVPNVRFTPPTIGQLFFWLHQLTESFHQLLRQLFGNSEQFIMVVRVVRVVKVVKSVFNVVNLRFFLRIWILKTENPFLANLA